MSTPPRSLDINSIGHIAVGVDMLRRVRTHLQQHYAKAVNMQTLADLAGLPVAQLERHFNRVFLLTPLQALNKLRIEAAMRLLRGDSSVASIGAACGFTDQSAFTRRFRSTVGMPRALIARRLPMKPPCKIRPGPCHHRV